MRGPYRVLVAELVTMIKGCVPGDPAATATFLSPTGVRLLTVTATGPSS